MLCAQFQTRSSHRGWFFPEQFPVVLFVAVEGNRKDYRLGLWLAPSHVRDSPTADAKEPRLGLLFVCADTSKSLLSGTLY